jgi:hypothetical protein
MKFQDLPLTPSSKLTRGPRGVRPSSFCIYLYILTKQHVFTWTKRQKLAGPLDTHDQAHKRDGFSIPFLCRLKQKIGKKLGWKIRSGIHPFTRMHTIV